LRHPFLKVSLLAFDALPEYPLRAQRNGFGRAKFATREVSVLSKQLEWTELLGAERAHRYCVRAPVDFEWIEEGVLQTDEDSHAIAQRDVHLFDLDPRQKPTASKVPFNRSPDPHQSPIES